MLACVYAYWHAHVCYNLLVHHGTVSLLCVVDELISTGTKYTICGIFPSLSSVWSFLQSQYGLILLNMMWVYAERNRFQKQNEHKLFKYAK
jgi:hypothetical protein